MNAEIHAATAGPPLTLKMQPLSSWLEVITTYGDDASNHGGGPGTNRSGGRDRRDGPTRAHGRARDRL